MPEFRIQPDAFASRHETRVRLLWCGTVLLLIVIPVLILTLRFQGLLDRDSNLKWLAMLSVAFAFVGAIILAGREALRLAEREMVFVLDNDGIVRRRGGFPDVRIAFSEIDNLRQEQRWLVVKSIEPLRKLAIPTDVKGFEVIRAELEKHHALSPQADTPPRRPALMMLSFLSWAAVMWLRDVRLVIPAIAIALTSLVLASHRLWTLSRRRKNRWFSFLCLGFVWLTAILLIYIRILRI